MFITFEGIEGSGKTLQVGLSAAYLEGKGVRCLVTREPGGTEFGAALRRVLLDAGGPQRDPVSELLLYLADRHQHLQEVVRPALREGVTVLSDRYHDATRAYQGAARGVSADLVDGLARMLGIGDPDRTVLLDLEVETALARARIRNETGGRVFEEGRFEAEDLAFHREVRKAYLDLARRFPGRIHVIDASGSPEAVFARIRVLLDEWFARPSYP